MQVGGGGEAHNLLLGPDTSNKRSHFKRGHSLDDCLGTVWHRQGLGKSGSVLAECALVHNCFCGAARKPSLAQMWRARVTIRSVSVGGGGS
jgi:hypothetical protein